MPSVKPSLPRLRRDGHWSVKGLVAHYPFYEKAGDILHDIAGNNDGSLVNGPAWGPSEVGAALALSGNDQYITLPGWTLTGSWTIAALARNERGGSAVSILFGDGSNDTDFFYARESQRQRFVNSAGAMADWVGDTDTLNRWRWYVLVADATGVTHYLDGVSQGRVAIVPSLSLQEIGSGHTTATVDWQGRIAYFGLYDRALSATEVAYLRALPGIVYEPGGMPWLGAAAAGVTVTPSVAAITASIPGELATGGALIAASVADVLSEAIAAQALGGAQITASVADMTSSLPAGAAIGGAKIAPSVLSLLAELPTETIITGAVVAVDPATAAITVLAVIFPGGEVEPPLHLSSLERQSIHVVDLRRQQVHVGDLRRQSVHADLD